MLKLFFWLLLLANGALFAMNYDYLGTAASGRREPQRLAQQLRPETLTILPVNSEKLVAPAKAADTVAETPSVQDEPVHDAQMAGLAETEAKQETIACIEIGNFTVSQAQKFETRLAELHLPVKPVRRQVSELSGYMVYIPSQGSKDGADKKAEELRRLGMGDFYIMPESSNNPALRWSISLGVFKTEPAAKAYIAQLIPKGVRNARVIGRHAGVIKQAWQLHHVDVASKAAIDRLKQDFPNQEVRDCAS